MELGWEDCWVWGLVKYTHSELLHRPVVICLLIMVVPVLYLRETLTVDSPPILLH